MIQRSTDAGATWTDITPVSLIGSEVVIYQLLFDPNAIGVVYAATGEGILKSLDDGLTWALMNAGLPNGAGNTRPQVHEIIGATIDGNFQLFVALRTQGTASWNAGGIYRSNDGANNWEDISGDLPTMGPESGMSYCYWRITVDPSNPDLLLVGTRRDWAFDQMGIYRTTNALAADSGSVSWDWNWDAENLDTTIGQSSWLDADWWMDQHIHLLAFAPGDANVVIAGADLIVKSSDKGLTWTEAYSTDNQDGSYTGHGLELMEVFDVTVDPSNPNTWWLGYDDMGLFKSSDGGQSYQRMDASQEPELLGTTDCACQIIVDPDDSNTIFMVRYGGDSDSQFDWNIGFLFKSEDGGTSWSQLGPGTIEGGRPKLLMFPGGTTATRKLLITIYGKGSFISEDSGVSWTTTDTNVVAEDLVRLWSAAIHPENSSIVYMGSVWADQADSEYSGSIYRSNNAGETWTRLDGTTVPSGQILDLAVDASGVIYAATTSNNNYLDPGEGTKAGGLYRSSDEGASWMRVLDQPRVDGVATKPGDSTQVVAAVSSFWNHIEAADFDIVRPGVYASADSGMTFERNNQDLSYRFFWFIKYNPTNTDQIFVGTHGGGYFIGQESDYSVNTSANSPITGLWWNSDESGWGVTLTQQFDVIFVTLFTYDSNGNPYWYVASDCRITDAGCTGILYEVKEGEELAATWDGTDDAVVVGNLSFVFSDNHTGSMTFTINGVTGSKQITRQVFNTLSPGAAMSALWYNPAESGWGMTLTRQSTKVFVTIFTYDASGKPYWYVASDCSVTANSCTGILYRVTGGAELNESWSGTNGAEEVGNISVNFQDDDNGTIDFDIDGVSGSKSITRQIWRTSN
jgi:hypothetical protein